MTAEKLPSKISIFHTHVYDNILTSVPKRQKEKRPNDKKRRKSQKAKSLYFLCGKHAPNKKWKIILHFLAISLLNPRHRSKRFSMYSSLILIRNTKWVCLRGYAPFKIKFGLF
jgi:hypothetical protein